MKILVIGAHPDDIEIFMYGTIAACFERGDIIVNCVATDGSAGGVKKGKELANLRTKETINGLNEFGKPIFLGFEDGKLSQAKNSQIIIDNLFERVNPDFIITHDPCDYHPDHRELSRLVSKGAGFNCPVFFCDTLMGVNFTPDYYVDVTAFFESKRQAILCHKSQSPTKFVEAAEIMNRYRAAQCNLPNKNFVEAFRFNNSFPFADLRNLLPPAPKLRSFNKNSKHSMI
jgi:N-acetylglucosamine malate deacetylase 1